MFPSSGCRTGCLFRVPLSCWRQRGRESSSQCSRHHLEASRFKNRELHLRPHHQAPLPPPLEQLDATGEAMAAAQPKPGKRLGGMAEALAIAADLGFAAPPTQEDQSSMDKSDDLVKVLRELTIVQRNIANLHVELQGRKDDKNIAHLTHVSEMEKKCESLARITAILKDVIQNKDRIIARLQQPYSLDCIPVEAEYQKQFSELLLKAASDYGALTTSVGDFQWSQNFRESPAVWGEMLRPIPAALASCTRFFEAMSAMRESFSTLQKLRVGHPSMSMTPGGSSDGSKYMTPPPQWRDGMMLDSWKQMDDSNAERGLDGIDHRRLSWPSSLKGDQ